MRRILLVCGIVSSLLYVAMNVFVASQWTGYNSASQTVSELSAIGAPTRTLWVALGIPYTLLVAAFGWGVRASAGGNRSLRIAGGVMAAYGIVGLGWPFAPMHLRDTLAAGGALTASAIPSVTSARFWKILAFASKDSKASCRSPMVSLAPKKREPFGRNAK